jgi:hypothetical protein
MVMQHLIFMSMASMKCDSIRQSTSWGTVDIECVYKPNGISNRKSRVSFCADIWPDPVRFDSGLHHQQVLSIFAPKHLPGTAKNSKKTYSLVYSYRITEHALRKQKSKVGMAICDPENAEITYRVRMGILLSGLSVF